MQNFLNFCIYTLTSSLIFARVLFRENFQCANYPGLPGCSRGAVCTARFVVVQ